VVVHDEAGFQFLDGPGRREAAGGQLFGNLRKRDFVTDITECMTGVVGLCVQRD
jgi:hypothetical protein